MLGVSCLIKDTRAVNDIKSAISLLVSERIGDGKGVLFPQVYKELRDAGLEVDAISAGYLYNELYSGYNDGGLSNYDQIVEYTGDAIAEQQKSLAQAILGEQPSVNEQEIGKLPPEKQVAKMIGQMFLAENFEGDKKTQSVMKQMETLLSKAVRTNLPSSAKDSAKDITQTLEDFFKIEDAKFERLDGGFNTLESLHKQLKTEVNAYVDGVTDKLGDEEAELFKQQWDNYVEGFMKSAYTIMLGKADKNKLLNEALKQAKVDGLHIVDVNGNVKWSSLMEFDNPEGIQKSVATLFREGIKTGEGVVTTFTPQQAQRIGEYFRGIYDDKMAAVKQAKIGNQRAKNISSKNIISDFVKEQGFVKLVKDKEGKLLLTQANWDAALKSVSSKIGTADKGVDVLKDKLTNYLKEQKNDKGERKFTDQQVDIIVTDFEGVVAAKLVPGTSTPHAIDRLIALNKLNGGKAFNEQTSYALNKLVGVSGIDQKVIDSIKELTGAAQNIMEGKSVDGATSDDIEKNRGAYAYQALSQIERKIKELIRENKISKSGQQRIVKYISDNMSAASTSLLINPKNFLENILTGISSNIAESVLLAVTNVRLFKQLGTSQKNFWTAFASHFSGGVSNEIINDTDLSTDIQAGERLRASNLAREFKKGNIVSGFLKSPAYAASIISRGLMNSFDAGFNSALLRKKTIGTVYSSLKAQGFSGKEVLDIMDSALNVSAEEDVQLNKQNEEIKKVLNSVGIYPTWADMQQNKLDMKLALYENALLAGSKLKGQNLTARQATEATKAIVESAALQAKVVGGKKQIPSGPMDFLNRIIYGSSMVALTPQREGFKSQRSLEEQGRLGAAARSQMFAEGWKNTVGRFAGGIANFLALATTATPYGFITAASLRGRKNTFLRDNTNADDVFSGEPGDIRKYAEYHNLMKSMVVRASMGSLAITGYIAKKLSEDDDEEQDAWVDNLMQTKSGRGLLNKFLPMGVNIAATILQDNKDPKMDSKMERLISVLSDVTGRTYDSWGSLRTAISRAKTDEQKQKAITGFLGSSLPTANINQGEQITRFWTTLQSATDPEKVKDVLAQEKIASKAYKDTENWVDALLVNGMISTIQRIIDDEKEYNRFKKEE